jgi:GTP-binding protein HflX
VLLTDTVGFIQKLPTQLVAAFRATLEELDEADILLHVIDISHPHAYEQTQTVDATLADLSVGEKPRLLALNKVDLLRRPDGEMVASLDEARALIHGAGAPPANVVLCSATRRWGLDRLLERVEQGLDGGLDVKMEASEVLARSGRTGAWNDCLASGHKGHNSCLMQGARAGRSNACPCPTPPARSRATALWISPTRKGSSALGFWESSGRM